MKTLNDVQIEGQYGHGALPIHPILRWARKKIGNSLVKGIPFDWNAGYDVRNVIGPITIKNQGQNDSCSGQSGSYFLEIQRRLQKITEGAISAKSIYAPIAYPGGGTTVVDLEKALEGVGGNLEATVSSYDINGNPLPEFFMAARNWMTQALSADALTRAGYILYDVGTNIDDVASAIQSYGACIMEITGQNGHTPGWLSDTPQPPVPDNGQPLFNHFLCLCGAKLINGQKYIVALESMGTGVGDQGIQYFSEAYFQSGFVRDCFTFIFDGNIHVPVMPPKSWWSGLTDFFQGWFSLDNLLGAKPAPTS